MLTILLTLVIYLLFNQHVKKVIFFLFLFLIFLESTHDQTEALAISDRIAVMNVGYIEQYGTPKEVFDDPKTLFVAQFVGESTTLEGKYKGDNTVILNGGEEVKIAVEEKIEPETPLSLIVRPENVSLKNNGGFPLEVEVHTIEYLGREVKLTGKLKDDTILLADILEEIDIITEKHVGDKITLYIKPEDLFVFRDKKRIIRNFREKKIIFILFSFFCVF